MSQTGFTPIQIYSSSTATNQPSASNLTNNTKGSELAINITDGKLFYKDNANAVQVIGWKTVPTTAGGTGLTTYTAGDLAYYASGTTLTKLGIGTVGQILTSTGSAPQWNTLSGVAVTTFSAGTTGFTPSIATSGAVTLAGTLALTNGGSGQTTAQLAMNAFAGAVTSGSYLRGNGTNVVMSTIQAADVPTLNQNTTGTAAGLSATLVATSGGTGQSSYTQGDLLYANSATTLAKLADVATGNALISGGVSADPSWGKIGLTTHVSGTLPIANGGTNATATPTAGGAVYGTGSAYAITAAGTTNQLLQSAGSGAPTWTSAINGVSIGQTTRAAGNFTAVLANTATNTFSGALVSAGDFEQGAKRYGYRGANGTSAGTTGTYTITMSGFPGQGSGNLAEAYTNYWVTVFSSAGGHYVQGVALYTNNFDGNAVLLATIGTRGIGGGVTFGVSGSSPTATITNSSGATPQFYWFTIGM